MLYDSAESAYYLKNEPVMDDEIEEYRKTVTIEKGEIIEAEWLGAEWVYGEEEEDHTKYHKFDKIRLGKISRLKNNITQTKYLELYSGWVDGVEFPWSSDKSRNDIRITKINGKVISKLDFSKLFLRYNDESDDKIGDSQENQYGLTKQFIN